MRQNVPHHARLAVHRPIGPGWLEVSTVAHDVWRLGSPEEREEWLEQGRREAQAFAAFLKDLFLSAGPSAGAAPILVETADEA